MNADETQILICVPPRSSAAKKNVFPIDYRNSFCRALALEKPAGAAVNDRCLRRFAACDLLIRQHT